MAKPFNTVWMNGFHYKLMILNFLSYLVHTISSYLWGQMFKVSFQMGTSSRHGMPVGVAQGGLISPVLFSLYVNDIPKPSHHKELALYVDDTPIIATSHKLTLLVNYLEPFLSNLQQWLSEWRITIISKSTAIICAWGRWCFIQPQPATLFVGPFQWVTQSIICE
jgi:retron-type reverse transcriptase